MSTHPFQLDQVVMTAPTLSVVRTVRGLYEGLNDDELLALAPQPAALVRFGPQEMELVLVSPSSENGGQHN